MLFLIIEQCIKKSIIEIYIFINFIGSFYFCEKYDCQFCF